MSLNATAISPLMPGASTGSFTEKLPLATARRALSRRRCWRGSESAPPGVAPLFVGSPVVVAIAICLSMPRAVTRRRIKTLTHISLSAIKGQLKQGLARLEVCFKVGKKNIHRTSSAMNSGASDASLRLLADASKALASSFDLSTTLPLVARSIIAHVAEGCVIDVLDKDDQQRVMAVTHRDSDTERRLLASVPAQAAEGDWLGTQNGVRTDLQLCVRDRHILSLIHI